MPGRSGTVAACRERATTVPGSAPNVSPTVGPAPCSSDVGPELGGLLLQALDGGVDGRVVDRGRRAARDAGSGGPRHEVDVGVAATHGGEERIRNGLVGRLQLHTRGCPARIGRKPPGWTGVENAAATRPGNQIAISRLADSGESEPCTRFSRFDRDRSPRIVPGAALRPSVAPLSARTTSTASSPSSTSATSGPLVTNARSGG